jgi:GTP-binding protein
MSNTVAIVGRPNVGKSTLFNRLIGMRKAIVDEIAGVTRDRHYGKVQWNGIEFSVIDTGGYVVGSTDIFEKEIRKQIEIALHEADVILFLVDVTAGVTSQDEQVAELLRKSILKIEKKKKIFLVVNKADTHEREMQSGEFYKLGMGDVHCISSISGRGTGELLDKIVTSFPSSMGRDGEWPILPKYAIVGRPNVGKSSLLNSLLGEERTIVTPIAGTTRDAIHTHYKKFNHEFLLIDTAGLRKKRKFDEDVEFYSNLRAIRAIEECDVCLLLLDAQVGMEAQDVNIFRLAERNKKGVVIIVNKWDLIEKKTNTANVYEKHIHEKIAPFTDVPVLFISALKKQRVMKVVETAEKVFLNRKKRISDEELTQALLPVIEAHQPPSEKGKLVEIYRVAQIPANYPIFVFYCSHPKAIKESYKRFLENKLREKFDFTGMPMQIYFRKK